MASSFQFSIRRLIFAITCFATAIALMGPLGRHIVESYGPGTAAAFGLLFAIFISAGAGVGAIADCILICIVFSGFCAAAGLLLMWLFSPSVY